MQRGPSTDPCRLCAHLFIFCKSLCTLLSRFCESFSPDILDLWFWQSFLSFLLSSAGRVSVSFSWFYGERIRDFSCCFVWFWENRKVFLPLHWQFACVSSSPSQAAIKPGALFMEANILKQSYISSFERILSVILLLTEDYITPVICLS